MSEKRLPLDFGNAMSRLRPKSNVLKRTEGPMSSRFLVLVILLHCCVGCASPRTVAPEQGSLRAMVRVVGESILSIQVCNATQHSLSLSEYDLPWKYRYSMNVVAVELDHLGDPLEQVFPIADRPMNQSFRTIGSGECLAGEIDLAARFPDLERIRIRRDVLCVWIWRPEPQDKHTEMHYGLFILPKK